VAFVLEVAIAAFDHQWPNGEALMREVRAMVTNRPNLPGGRPEDDLFEGHVHRIALAVLTAQMHLDSVESYYEAISNRLAAPGATGAATRRRLVEPRLALERAIAIDLSTRPLIDAHIDSSAPAARLDGAAQKRVTLALDAYTAAAVDAGNSAEATIRQAYLNIRIGNPERAYALLNGVHTPDDPIVKVWYGLVLGQTLSALDRDDAAIDAYRATWSVARGSQSVAVALAALFLHTGDRDAALEWAGVSRHTPVTSFDPWWLYWTGDARAVSSLLAELRTLAMMRNS